MSFLNIYKSIEICKAENNDSGLIYQYGRILRIIVDVPPINFEALEVNVVDDLDSYESIDGFNDTNSSLVSEYHTFDGVINIK